MKHQISTSRAIALRDDLANSAIAWGLADKKYREAAAAWADVERQAWIALGDRDRTRKEMQDARVAVADLAKTTLEIASALAIEVSSREDPYRD